jgi:hypothetical protein
MVSQSEKSLDRYNPTRGTSRETAVRINNPCIPLQNISRLLTATVRPCLLKDTCPTLKQVNDTKFRSYIKFRDPPELNKRLTSQWLPQHQYTQRLTSVRSRTLSSSSMSMTHSRSLARYELFLSTHEVKVNFTFKLNISIQSPANSRNSLSSLRCSNCSRSSVTRSPLVS